MRSTTGLFQTGFLSLLHSGVTGQEAGLLQCRTQALVILQQGTGQTVTDGTGLAGYAAAAYTANDVKLLGGVGDGQRLTHDQLQGLCR